MPTEHIRRGYQATAPNPGTMSVDEEPRVPTITGNPNSSEIGDWLQQNWKPLFIGIGIAAFLFWIFSSKK